MEEKGVRGAKQRAAAGVGLWLTAPHANIGKDRGPEAQQSKRIIRTGAKSSTRRRQTPVESEETLLYKIQKK